MNRDMGMWHFETKENAEAFVKGNAGNNQCSKMVCILGSIYILYLLTHLLTLAAVLKEPGTRAMVVPTIRVLFYGHEKS